MTDMSLCKRLEKELQRRYGFVPPREEWLRRDAIPVTKIEKLREAVGIPKTAILGVSLPTWCGRGVDWVLTDASGVPVALATRGEASTASSFGPAALLKAGSSYFIDGRSHGCSDEESSER